MHLRETFIPLAVAASLGLAACGGGDGGDSGLSRTELAAKADSICKRAQTAARAVPAPESLADADVAAAYFDRIGPITHKETEDLAGLEPAKDAKADWEAFVDKQRAADDLLQTIRRKANARDPSGQQDLQRVAATGQEVAGAAKKVGADQCAE